MAVNLQEAHDHVMARIQSLETRVWHLEHPVDMPVESPERPGSSSDGGDWTAVSGEGLAYPGDYKGVPLEDAGQAVVTSAPKPPVGDANATV